MHSRHKCINIYTRGSRETRSSESIDEMFRIAIRDSAKISRSAARSTKYGRFAWSGDRGSAFFFMIVRRKVWECNSDDTRARIDDNDKVPLHPHPASRNCVRLTRLTRLGRQPVRNDVFVFAYAAAMEIYTRSQPTRQIYVAKCIRDEFSLIGYQYYLHRSSYRIPVSITILLLFLYLLLSLNIFRLQYRKVLMVKITS